ncbi:uncharacterized protein KY384_001403 [Bacidia gigantensis]|uniref:uncharacterized protein n=1 Tax=Bacidia gigantensis TaxID=2732470 RepID=UPI001D0553BD|nr:uncharacterized protein KY384_001403 [Bacidia gigantensis]KAG8533662.1 hypothetical protein KY384_001403 [Bacidia gigantensis]
MHEWLNEGVNTALQTEKSQSHILSIVEKSMSSSNQDVITDEATVAGMLNNGALGKIVKAEIDKMVQEAVEQRLGPPGAPITAQVVFNSAVTTQCAIQRYGAYSKAAPSNQIQVLHDPLSLTALPSADPSKEQAAKEDAESIRSIVNAQVTGEHQPEMPPPRYPGLSTHPPLAKQRPGTNTLGVFIKGQSKSLCQLPTQKCPAKQQPDLAKRPAQVQSTTGTPRAEQQVSSGCLKPSDEAKEKAKMFLSKAEVSPKEVQPGLPATPTKESPNIEAYKSGQHADSEPLSPLAQSPSVEKRKRAIDNKPGATDTDHSKDLALPKKAKSVVAASNSEVGHLDFSFVKVGGWTGLVFNVQSTLNLLHRIQICVL